MGRPDLAEEFYEICRRLLLFYNASGNYENNIKKGLFGISTRKLGYTFFATLQYLKDAEQPKQRPQWVINLKELELQVL
jgi:hypothetical protein